MSLPSSVRRAPRAYLSGSSAVIGITAISFVLTLAEIPRGDWFTLSALSLSSGVAALALMGAAALLGGRLRFVEALFGGLDRVYLAHKWLAVWALVFASVHFSFPALLQEWETVTILSLPRFYMRLVRQLSLLALGLIVLLALNRKIPYHRWRLLHKLSGPLFAIVVLHWLSFRNPIELESPGGVWLATMSTLGLAAAAYKLLLYRFVSNHAEYRVVNTNPGPSGLHLELAPVGKPIQFKPGQFGFISIKEDGLREPHPFTIASGRGGHVHFVIRNLGDYTSKLTRETKVGMYADIYAPYGRFVRPARAEKEVWIAGGVGISPFLAWLTDEETNDLSHATLFYFFTPGREFPSAARVEELAALKNAQFVPVSTGPNAPEFSERLERIVREVGAANVQVSFCGPKGLLEHVRKELQRLGVPESNLHFEYFEFR
jgi:predicted ferric reductase